MIPICPTPYRLDPRRVGERVAVRTATGEAYGSVEAWGLVTARVRLDVTSAPVLCDRTDLSPLW